MADQETEIDVWGFEHLIPRHQVPDIDDDAFEFLSRESYRRATLRKERFVQAHLRELIRMVGHDGVIRRVEARRAGAEGGRKAKGKRGRPVGLKYHDIDQQLMVLAALLGMEWKDRGHPCPARHALYKKIVDLCWDREASEILGVVFDPLGPSKASVVTRLMGRVDFPSATNPSGAKSQLDVLLPPSEAGFYSFSPTSERGKMYTGRGQISSCCHEGQQNRLSN